MPYEYDNEINKFQNYEIYIGNDSDYRNNIKCDGGPFMRTDNSSNYHSWTDADDNVTRNVWNFGKEVWCNLEGRYMHIIADFSHLSGEDYSMELCSLGIMGSQYVRDQTLPSTLEISKEDLTYLTVANIYSAMPIGNELNINLRQSEGSELAFVTLTEEADQTIVTLDAKNA